METEFRLALALCGENTIRSSVFRLLAQLHRGFARGHRISRHRGDNHPCRA